MIKLEVSLLLPVTCDVDGLIFLLHVALKAAVDTWTVTPPHPHFEAACHQTRSHRTPRAVMTVDGHVLQNKKRDVLRTCTTRPVFVPRHRKRTRRLQSGFLSWLGICRGGREEWRGEGVGLVEPYEEPALPPCFHDNGSPTVFSRGTASAFESSSQWRLRPSRSFFFLSTAPLFSFFLYCLCVFKSKQHFILESLLYFSNLDVEHHLHLNQGRSLPLCLVEIPKDYMSCDQHILKIFRPSVL